MAIGLHRSDNGRVYWAVPANVCSVTDLTETVQRQREDPETGEWITENVVVHKSLIVTNNDQVIVDGNADLIIADLFPGPQGTNKFHTTG